MGVRGDLATTIAVGDDVGGEQTNQSLLSPDETASKNRRESSSRFLREASKRGLLPRPDDGREPRSGGSCPRFCQRRPRSRRSRSRTPPGEGGPRARPDPDSRARRGTRATASPRLPPAGHRPTPYRSGVARAARCRRSFLGARAQTARLQPFGTRSRTAAVGDLRTRSSLRLWASGVHLLLLRQRQDSHL
jgi:hypothetical protein